MADRALTAILHKPAQYDRQLVMNEVVAHAQRGLNWGPPLRFENTFAMIVRRSDADRYGVRHISDLAKVETSFGPGIDVSLQPQS